jgi:hypothetical protein
MSFRDLVPEMLHEFEDVFGKESLDALPDRRQWDHAIELNTDDPLQSVPYVTGQASGTQHLLR